jgi:hypothetical protein
MKMCAFADPRLRTFANPLSWAARLVMNLVRVILPPCRAIDGFAGTGNSLPISSKETRHA